MAKQFAIFSHGIYNYRGADAEVNDGKSIVLPDLAFSVADLFERARAGMPLAFHEAFFTPEVKLGDLDVSKLAGMDIVNQKIALRGFTESVERYQAQLDKMYQEEQAAEKAKLMDELAKSQNAKASQTPVS